MSVSILILKLSKLWLITLKFPTAQNWDSTHSLYRAFRPLKVLFLRISTLFPANDLH